MGAQQVRQDGVDPSLLAVFRIVIIMLWVDRWVHPRERVWFADLIKNRAFSHDQRELLQTEFQAPARLEDVFDDVDRPDDLDRVLEWSRAGMHVDGDWAPQEKEFYLRLRGLCEERKAKLGRDGAHQKLAESIIDMENRKALWGGLEEVGQQLNRRVHLPAGPVMMSGDPAPRPLSINVIIWFLLGLGIVGLVVRTYLRHTAGK